MTITCMACRELIMVLNHTNDNVLCMTCGAVYKPLAEHGFISYRLGDYIPIKPNPLC